MEPVKLDDLAASLARRGAPLTPESATFITLECVEALAGSPRVLSADGVLIAPDGVVTLVEEALSPALDDAEVLRGAVELLESLLLVPSASVMDLAERVREGSVQGRAALVGELTALLVPFNRSAARRMLGRLVREHQRGLAEPAVLTHDDADAAPSPPEDAGADATWLDRPGGPLAHAADATDPGESPAPRRDPKRTQGLAMLLLSAVALVGAAWFLWSRL
jgi:hypothetical protein